MYKDEYSIYNRDEKVFYPIEQAQQIEELTELSLTPQTLSPKTQKDMEFANYIRQTLQVGQTFSTYAELFQTIGVRRAEGGKNRKKQKEHLERFFKWVRNEETGIITITEIAQVPRDPQGFYAQSIQTILLLLLAKENTPRIEMDRRYICCIEVTTNKLFTLLGLRTPNYFKYLDQLYYPNKRTIIFNSQAESEWADCMMIINHKISQVVRDALESMQNRGLITYSKKIKYKDQRGNYLLATENEQSQVVFMENEVLVKQYKLNNDSKFVLFKRKLWQSYKTSCKEKARADFGWLDYQWIYQIRFFPNELIRAEFEKFPDISPNILFQQKLEEINKSILQYIADGHASDAFLTEDEVWEGKGQNRAEIAQHLLDLQAYLVENDETFESYKKTVLTLDQIKD